MIENVSDKVENNYYLPCFIENVPSSLVFLKMNPQVKIDYTFQKEAYYWFMTMQEYEQNFEYLKKIECGVQTKVKLIIDDEVRINGFSMQDPIKYVKVIWIYHNNSLSKFQMFKKQNKVMCENVICLTKDKNKKQKKQSLNEKQFEAIMLQTEIFQFIKKNEEKSGNQQSESQLPKKKFVNFIFYDHISYNSYERKPLLNSMLKQKTDELQIMKEFAKAFFDKVGLISSQCEQFFKECSEHPEKILRNIIQKYTQNSFFHRVLNNFLRAESDVTVIFYIQPFYKSLFFKIREIYLRQQSGVESIENVNMKQFTCFRGGEIIEEELQMFIEHVGNIVENLSFLSTTYDFKKVLTFAENVIFIIRVKDEERLEKYDNGYAFIERYSIQKNEKEVLFNSLNTFFVKKVMQDISIHTAKQFFHLKQHFENLPDDLSFTFIELEYGAASSIVKSCQQQEFSKEKEIFQKELVIEYLDSIDCLKNNQIDSLHHRIYRQYLILRHKIIVYSPVSMYNPLEELLNYSLKIQQSLDEDTFQTTYDLYLAFAALVKKFSKPIINLLQFKGQYVSVIWNNILFFLNICLKGQIRERILTILIITNLKLLLMQKSNYLLKASKLSQLINLDLLSEIPSFVIQYIKKRFQQIRNKNSLEIFSLLQCWMIHHKNRFADKQKYQNANETQKYIIQYVNKNILKNSQKVNTFLSKYKNLKLKAFPKQYKIQQNQCLQKCNQNFRHILFHFSKFHKFVQCEDMQQAEKWLSYFLEIFYQSSDQKLVNLVRCICDSQNFWRQRFAKKQKKFTDFIKYLINRLLSSQSLQKQGVQFGLETLSYSNIFCCLNEYNFVDALWCYQINQQISTSSVFVSKYSQIIDKVMLLFKYDVFQYDRQNLITFLESVLQNFMKLTFEKENETSQRRFLRKRIQNHYKNLIIINYYEIGKLDVALKLCKQIIFIENQQINILLEQQKQQLNQLHNQFFFIKLISILIQKIEKIQENKCSNNNNNNNNSHNNSHNNSNNNSYNNSYNNSHNNSYNNNSENYCFQQRLKQFLIFCIFAYRLFPKIYDRYCNFVNYKLNFQIFTMCMKFQFEKFFPFSQQNFEFVRSLCIKVSKINQFLQIATDQIQTIGVLDFQ